MVYDEVWGETGECLEFGAACKGLQERFGWW
jgi:hypothetical protein